MRASFEVSLGSTKSLGGLDVLAGSGLAVEVDGSGVEALGAAFVGFERVRAIAMMSMLILMFQMYVTTCVVAKVDAHVGVATRRTRPTPAKCPCFMVSGEITAGVNHTTACQQTPIHIFPAMHMPFAVLY